MKPQTTPQYHLTDKLIPATVPVTFPFSGNPLYGIFALFPEPENLLHATEAALGGGYRHIQTYTPFPVEGVIEAIQKAPHSHASDPPLPIPFMTLIGGLLGGGGGYTLQYFAAVVDYPISAGGRPYHSWPSFIPVTFELTILFAALLTVISLLAFNNLPRLNHPVFNFPEFKRASHDGFFLCIKAHDPLFDASKTEAFLKALHPLGVYSVKR